ncbi:hypothetical protein C8R45DRAFT_1116976 [Mycena sanguinolenta]|nr:hypothetical protein C8R45DRAFT_1116976 [Mycena sanguinolenta]
MSSESSPALKRQRTESTGIPTPITRSESWFSDGNVILQAVDIVHLSVLAHNSSILQGIPQPPDSEQRSIEGCPVVELSDEAEDVEYLVKAKSTLQPVCAPIRLGRKYDFKDFLDSAARVTAICPATLRAYDALLATGTWRTIKWYKGIEVDLFTLVRENNISTALPIAFYRLVDRTLVNIRHLDDLDIG